MPVNLLAGRPLSFLFQFPKITGHEKGRRKKKKNMTGSYSINNARLPVSHTDPHAEYLPLVSRTSSKKMRLLLEVSHVRKKNRKLYDPSDTSTNRVLELSKEPGCKEPVLRRIFSEKVMKFPLTIQRSTEEPYLNPKCTKGCKVLLCDRRKGIVSEIRFLGASPDSEMDFFLNLLNNLPSLRNSE